MSVCTGPHTDHVIVRQCTDAYAKLARQMALPQTASLALAGPVGPIPGTAWGRAWYAEDDEAQPYTEVHQTPDLTHIVVYLRSNRSCACYVFHPPTRFMSDLV